MKTIILQLDAYDDVISTCDKMNWSNGERLLLVWPERRPNLDGRLDMVRLQRRSRQVGAQLALVTRDPQTRYQALHLGIPVFSSVKKANSSPWRVARRFRQAAQPALPPPPEDRPPFDLQAVLQARQDAHLPAWRGANHPAWFIVGVLAVLALAAVLLPQAEIRLAPAARIQDVMLSVQADPQRSTPDLAGSVPAVRQEIIVEGSQSRAATGSMRLPDHPAQGEVVFTNLNDQAVSIPPGAIVRTLSDPLVRFNVTRGGTLAAGPGLTTTLPIVAVIPGEGGNLPAGALTAIEGLLGAQATAVNLRPTRGGSDRPAPAATSEDIAALDLELRRSLAAQAQAQLQASLPPGDLLILSSLEIAETLDEELRPGRLLPGEVLSLRLRLKFRALVVRGDDLRRLAEQIFNANLPSGFQPDVDSLAWEVISPAGAAPGLMQSNQFEMHAHRQITAQIDEQRLLQAALGANLPTVQQRLQALAALESTPQIALTPAWWPRLPIAPFRIHIIQQNP